MNKGNKIRCTLVFEVDYKEDPIYFENDFDKKNAEVELAKDFIDLIDKDYKVIESKIEIIVDEL